MNSAPNFTYIEVASSLFQLRRAGEYFRNEGIEAIRLGMPLVSDEESIRLDNLFLASFVTSQRNIIKQTRKFTNFTPNEFNFLSDLMRDSVKVK